MARKQMCRSPKGYSTRASFNKNSYERGLVVEGYKSSNGSRDSNKTGNRSLRGRNY
jgi:hypothetical protein